MPNQIASLLMSLTVSGGPGEFPQDRFCENIQTILEVEAGSSQNHLQGVSAPSMRLLDRHLASRLWLDQLIQNQRFQPYLDAQRVFPNAGLSDKLRLNNTHILARSIGSQRPLLYSDDINDLRLLPFSQQGRDLLLVTKGLGSLDGRRAQSVIAAAERQSISLFIVWLGTEESQQKSPREVLRILALATGGTLLDLSDRKNICGRSA